MTWAAQATAEILAALGSEFGSGAAARGPIRLPDFQASARYAEEAGTDQNARRRGRRHREGEQRRKRKRGGRARKSARNSRSLP